VVPGFAWHAYLLWNQASGGESGPRASLPAARGLFALKREMAGNVGTPLIQPAGVDSR